MTEETNCDDVVDPEFVAVLTETQAILEWQQQRGISPPLGADACAVAAGTVIALVADNDRDLVEKFVDRSSNLMRVAASGKVVKCQ